MRGYILSQPPLPALVVFPVSVFVDLERAVDLIFNRIQRLEFQLGFPEAAFDTWVG